MGEKDAKMTPHSTQSYERITQALQPLGEVTGKKMFGGYGIFESDTMFALVNSQGGIFFKVDDSNRWRYERIEAARHGRMPYYQVPEDVLGNEDSLHEWAQESIDIAHKSKKK